MNYVMDFTRYLREIFTCISFFYLHSSLIYHAEISAGEITKNFNTLREGGNGKMPVRYDGKGEALGIRCWVLEKHC